MLPHISARSLDLWAAVGHVARVFRTGTFPVTLSAFLTVHLGHHGGHGSASALPALTGPASHRSLARCTADRVVAHSPMAAPRVRMHALPWRPRCSDSRDTDTTPIVHPTGPATSTSTDHGGPPQRHSIRWCSTTSRRSSPKPPRAILWAAVCRRGWRRIFERTYAAGSSHTGSRGYGVRTVATSGYSRSHVRVGASAPHATRAAWPRSPPTSLITCCLTFPCDSGS